MNNQVLVVKNRTNKTFEFMFDGQVHIVPAREEVPFMAAAARHGIKKSTISFNPITGTAVRALCLADAFDADEEVEARVPGSEIIERQPDDKVELKTFANPDMRGARVTSPLEE